MTWSLMTNGSCEKKPRRLERGVCGRWRINSTVLTLAAKRQARTVLFNDCCRASTNNFLVKAQAASVGGHFQFKPSVQCCVLVPTRPLDRDRRDRLEMTPMNWRKQPIPTQINPSKNMDLHRVILTSRLMWPPAVRLHEMAQGSANACLCCANDQFERLAGVA
jgi:hypothetical protein